MKKLALLLCALIGSGIFTRVSANQKSAETPVGTEMEDSRTPGSDVVKRYAWEGWLEGDIHFRLEAEQNDNDLIIGEMTYFRKNGKVSDIPVYGSFMEIGDGEWLLLHEYDKRMECGTIAIDLGANDAIYSGTWNYGDKELKITKSEKVSFSEGKHETFFYPAYADDVNGEFGFTYYKSLDPPIEAGGYAELEVLNNLQVKYHINQNIGGVAETEGISTLNGNTFTGSHLNFQFEAYVYKDCLYIKRTNPDDSQTEDWGVAGTIEGIYLRH